MKFGLFHTVQWPEGTDQRDRYRESLDEAIHAEKVGLDAVWLTEHHFSRHGLISDSLNVLSHLAAETSRIRLGTAVAVLPFHNPVRLAEAAATVDVLSDGRLDFGVGRGYQWLEFNGFAVDMAERPSRFEESMDLIVKSWTATEPFSHQGQHWQYGDIQPQPRPLQEPHPPIWVATDSEDGLLRCAQNDWGVMLPQGRSIQVVAEQVGRYKEALNKVGKPYDPSKLVLARGLYVAKDDETAWAEAQPPYVRFLQGAAKLAAPPTSGPPAMSNPFDTDSLRDAVVFGGPESCIASLRKLQDLGVEYVIFFIHFGGLAHGKIIQSLELFAKDVAPALVPAGAVN